MSEIKLKLINDQVHGIDLTFLDSENCFTVQEVFLELKNNIYGLEDINLSHNDVVIDVGANVGMFSIYVNKKFGCKIIAFEPVKQNYDNFVRNILLNKLNPDDFEIYNYAVTDKSGDVVKIGIQEWNLGGSSMFYANHLNNETATTVDLNDYITTDCKFLKLDCEGAEYYILPSIMDKINVFDYIGIEFHFIENSEFDGYKSHELLRKVFKGKLFPNELTRMPKISSYSL